MGCCSVASVACLWHKPDSMVVRRPWQNVTQPAENEELFFLHVALGLQYPRGCFADLEFQLPRWARKRSSGYRGKGLLISHFVLWFVLPTLLCSCCFTLGSYSCTRGLPGECADLVEISAIMRSQPRKDVWVFVWISQNIYLTEDRPTAHGQRWSRGTHLGSDQSRLRVLKVNFFLRCALPCLQWLTRRIARGALSEAFLCFVKSASQLRPFFTLVGGFSEDLALARFKETLPSKAEQQTKRCCGHFVPRMKQSHPRFCNRTSSRVSLSLNSWMFDDVQCGQYGQWVKIDSWTQLRIGPFGLCMNNRGALVPFGTLQQFWCHLLSSKLWLWSVWSVWSVSVRSSKTNGCRQVDAQGRGRRL